MGKTFHRLIFSITATTLSALTTPVAAQPSFQGIGDLAGGIFQSRANGVSADGSVVVGQGRTASGDRAFRWTSLGGMTSLGILPGGAFDESRANCVSDDGFVIVGFGFTAGVAQEAFRWALGTGMVGLGQLPGGVSGSESFGVSADGSLVVGLSERTLGFEAFTWTSGGGMIGLGDLPGGTFASKATGVSANGLVVGGQGRSTLGFEVFRWTSGGGMVALGDLPGGVFFSDAFGISADGSALGGWRMISDSDFEAFRWTSGGGMVGLGDLPGGIFESRANSVSADGSLVVGQGTSSSGLEAFIWDDVNGMQSLQVVLEAQLGSSLTGWTLTDAVGISADGSTIVGFGNNPSGFQEAYVAVILPLDLCLGDVSGDGNVNVTDLLDLLAAWGPNPGHPADINGDGNVNVTDLLALLGAWGVCP